MRNEKASAAEQDELFRDEPAPYPGPIRHTSKQVFFLHKEDDPLLERPRGRASETEARTSSVTRSLRRTGLNRELAKPDPLGLSKLDELAHEMPNFAPVIDTVVRPHVHMVNAGVIHRMAPVLLLGEPGVGKTHFARRLARILGLQRPLQIQLAAETNGSSMAGSSSFWSNASPGLLFEALAWGTGVGAAVANPLVLLDELDKAQTSTNYDPIGALYTLLEADTASDFQDQSLPDLLIDTTSVRWIATANNVNDIPGPLKSRMCVFEIPMPSPEQQRNITLRIYGDLLAKYHLPLAEQLPPSVLDHVAAMSPRTARLALDCAIASAVSRCSFEVEWQDLGTFASRPKTSLRNRIGFR